MNIQLAAMLAGLFVVPGVLLAVGHRLRKRSLRVQSAFIGAAIAHILAGVAATVASMISPAEWRSDDLWRGVFGFWMLLVAPIIGATLGYLRGANSNTR